MATQKAPVPTLERMATYLTYLSELDQHGIAMISSAEMEKRTGINAAQFRKDLSYFGEFGRPGIGYSVQDLVARIARILRVENEQRVLLVGAGNLGSAVAGYPGLKRQNFNIVAVFDNNYSKIGRKLWDLDIFDIAELRERNEVFGARIGIIAVPAVAAQQVAEELMKADVRAILNFAPVALKVPSGIAVRNVDFVQELAVLSYQASEKEGHVSVPLTAVSQI